MTSTAATTYQFRVAGHLDDHWGTWLDSLTLTRQPDGTTVLTVRVVDQAQLHGVLARLRDIGVPLLSVTTRDTTSPNDQPGPRGGTAPQPALRHAVTTERLTRGLPWAVPLCGSSSGLR